MFLYLLAKLSKASAPSALKLLNIVLMFITSLLLLFLNLACLTPSKSFSEIYLIKSSSNATVISAGYFKMCETTALAPGKHNSTKVCATLHNFKASGGLAYQFAEHVVRPYFVVIAAVVGFVALALCISTAIVLQSRKLGSACRLATFVALSTTLIAACWQQVAVQAAVVLIPQEIKRGHRAAGLVWSAVALDIIACCSQAFIASREAAESLSDDRNTLGSNGSDFASTVEKAYNAL